jgi:hypothetical protein
VPPWEQGPRAEHSRVQHEAVPQSLPALPLPIAEVGLLELRSPALQVSPALFVDPLVRQHQKQGRAQGQLVRHPLVCRPLGRRAGRKP